MPMPGGRGEYRLDYLPDKACRVRVKGSKWLARRFTVDLTAHDEAMHDFLLLRAGDANNDNFVDVFDLDILIQSFNLCSGDTGYNASADLNCDDCVDVFDLDLMVRNFNAEGEE
jgi:hypothetical protein